MEILEEIKGSTSSKKKYKIKCTCGNIYTTLACNYNSGKSKSCGKGKCHSRWIDITGEAFGFLQVIKFNDQTHKWTVECVCGSLKEYKGHDLRKGKVNSCGCKTKYLASQKLNSGVESLWVSLFNNYKSSAKSRGYNFELTPKQLKSLCQSNCNYCGVKPSNINTRKHLSCDFIIKFNGIDRVNNQKGYTKVNTVPCCKTCNLAKRDSTLEEFEAWISQLIKFKTS